MGRSGRSCRKAKLRVMPNIATTFKAEISRIARKEVRSDTEILKKASAQYRSEIAALKRRIAGLEKQLKKQVTANGRSAPAVEEQTARKGIRFSPERLAAHRKRLGLSAEALG